MSGRKTKGLIITSFILVISLLAGYFVVNSTIEKKLFKQEINKLKKKDIVKYRFNDKVKTSGSYGVVEKKMKNYLDDCSLNYRNIMNIEKDKKFLSILSADNYIKDKPNFDNSLKYLNKLKDKYDTNTKELLKCSDKKNIKSNIVSANINGYYESIYKKEMLDNKLLSKIKDSIDESKESREKVGSKLDNTIKVIKLLKDNKNKWTMNKKAILFKDNKLYLEYDKLVNNIVK